MPKKKKATPNRTLIWVAVFTIIATITLTVLLNQRQSPPLDRPVAIRYALVNTCGQMARMLYPNLSADLTTNACFQEAIDLYDAHTEAVSTCYDTIDRTDLFAWTTCLTEQDADFSGVYLEAAASQ